MQEEENKMIDVGEADQVETEIDLDKPAEQTKPVEEKVEVEQIQEEEKPVAAETDTQKEESKEDELKKYSEGVQKRIAKLTRKMREAERQKEEAIQFADRTKKENEDLQTRFSKLDKSYVNEFESRVTTNLDAARSALKTAIEAQDVDAQVKAQEQIATLTADAARLASLKTLKDEQPEKQVNVTPQRAEKTAKIDPRADAWASNNPWFGNDTAMTYTAFDVHKTLVEKEGFDPQSEEYYAEIDKRMRLEFPQKFDKLEGNTTEKVKPAQTVASARRPAQTGRKKTVKLTPSQVAIAKRLGVPLEEYAKQLTVKEA
jgi:DNA repair exonuclease SbcCD ATPase subunit